MLPLTLLVKLQFFYINICCFVIIHRDAHCTDKHRGVNLQFFTIYVHTAILESMHSLCDCKSDTLTMAQPKPRTLGYYEGRSKSFEPDYLPLDYWTKNCYWP